MNALLNQVAVITGAGRGIGRAIALEFARQGADVACLSRTAENAVKVAEEIRALGRRAWAIGVDVADPAAVKAASEQVLAATPRVDILVNNAGVTRDTLLLRMTDEDWDVVLDTNLKGAFLVTRAFARTFVRQRSGRILFISSIVGLLGSSGQTNYGASKAGLLGLAKSVAREFASRGITANTIAPGFIQTDMTSVLSEALRAEVLKRIPIAAFGQPEDVAAAAVFFASPAARYITGQVLAVDGGMAM